MRHADFVKKANKGASKTAQSMWKSSPLKEILYEIYSHLGAALMQAQPTDDEIIIGHVRDAHELAGKGLDMEDEQVKEAGTMFTQSRFASIEDDARQSIWGFVDMDLYADKESHFWAVLEEDLGREPTDDEWWDFQQTIKEVLKKAGLGE